MIDHPRYLSSESVLNDEYRMYGAKYISQQPRPPNSYKLLQERRYSASPGRETAERRKFCLPAIYMHEFRC